MHKVSIVIPMYNESRYIARCLDSLKNQSYKDFEIILIDDGSKDNTIKIAEGYKKNFKLTILKQQHGGPGKARNRGAKEAKGDVLIFVDADMAFDKNYIQELTKPIIQNKEIGTNHGWEYVINLQNPIARAFGNIRRAYDPKHTRQGIFRAIRKDKFLDRGGFDTSRGYSDDNLGEHGTSLSVKTAIAYHNNPESFKEIYKHSIRVGNSLWKTGDIIAYLKKYKLFIISFSILLCIMIRYMGVIKNQPRYILPIIVLGIIIVLILIKTIQRTIKEKYLSHILYIPIVMITRGLGYITGAGKYIFTKKTY